MAFGHVGFGLVLTFKGLRVCVRECMCARALRCRGFMLRAEDL